ncbi:MAG: threonine synthase [Candidatus Micrarchaeia archaeon]
MEYEMVCRSCGKKYPSSYNKQVCESCGSILEVVYLAAPKSSDFKGDGFWSYANLLPDSKYRNFEVGSTRLIQSHESSSLYLKLETDNPTNSFKDRGSVIEVSKALEYGYDEIVCASTGNMAFSITYYANILGIKARIYISNNASVDKINDIKAIGDAKIIKVNGDFNKAQGEAAAYAKKAGAFLAGDYCYRKEGQKTIAYELLKHSKFDAIFVPIGNATLISGIFKALKEMKNSGFIDYMPKIIGVQASGCDPVVKALSKNTSIKYIVPRTKADAIAVGFPTFGDQGVEAIKSTKGFAYSIKDSELEKAQHSFIKEYGLVAELGGIAAYAAALASISEGKMKGKRIAAIVSGSNV